MSSLRVVFAGTPDFAAISLQALIHSQHQVIQVLTQPDRPQGRGKKLVFSDTKQLALDNNIPVWQPQSLRDPKAVEQLKALQPDVLVVVAYGLIIPPEVLAIPQYGCLNVHGSLLPRWRGAAPIHRAIQAGDEETGATIMLMDEGLDTGPMLYKVSTPITAEDTGGSLYQRVAEQGAQALVKVLDNLEYYLAHQEAQEDSQATYAHKLTKSEGALDWHASAQVLARQVRAFNPWPVAWAQLAGQTLRIWEASAQTGQGAPGEILHASAQGIEVACGEGSLLLQQLQLPGKKRLSAQEVLNGHGELLAVGKRFDG